MQIADLADRKEQNNITIYTLETKCEEQLRMIEDLQLSNASQKEENVNHSIQNNELLEKMQKLAMDAETNYSELKKKYNDALLKVSTLEQKLEDKGRKAVELVESHLDLTTALEGLNKENRELVKL